MKQDSRNSSELPPLSPANEKPLSEMVRFVELAQGCTISFARCNQPALRRQILARLNGLLAPQEFYLLEISLQERRDNLRRIIKGKLEESMSLAGSGKTVISISGFELSIPSEEEHPAALSILNISRELYRQELPYPLIIWLPEYALRKLASAAPDFWAWRSGVFEFTTEEEMLEGLSTDIFSRQEEFDNLSLEDKKEKISVLQGLLEDYEEKARSTGAKEDQRAVAKTLVALGKLWWSLGDYSIANHEWKRALEIFQELGDKRDIASSLCQLGNILQLQGNYAGARQQYEESMQIARKLGDKRSIASSLHNLGMILQRQGDYGRAHQQYTITPQHLRCARECYDCG
ncbi:MAG: tetratricopeptide repeat protein, partial [bacterium]|nr:tetratricopeptide repeat protein [bacterium]